MKSFIPEKTIDEILQANKNPEDRRVKDILDKAADLKGLTPVETAALLQCQDKEMIEGIFEAAYSIKESIYGNRLVIFAPLYLSNFCVNNCLYCGFRKENTALKRKRLSLEEIQREVECLEEQGQKRLLLVAGEDPEFSRIDLLTKTIARIYETKKGKGSIRRVNINVAPMTVKDFRILKKSGIGTYQLFQETYHRQTYESVHPNDIKRQVAATKLGCRPEEQTEKASPKKKFLQSNDLKSNYLWRLYAIDRAQEAGIDDVGIGALFGLYDYKFEVLALLYHSLHLEKRFGAGPHTISVPRIKKALNAPLSSHSPYVVSDEDLKKIVAVLRLAVPYTGLILSTRESPALRNDVLSLGISQLSAGSRTNPGAYSEAKDDSFLSEQFQLEDNRDLKEVIKDIIQKGFFPSFCTACYRTGRTGQDFMSLAKLGAIKIFCLPNCLLTFKEYALDYGEDKMRKQANNTIAKELANIANISVRKTTKRKLEQLDQGARDLYF